MKDNQFRITVTDVLNNKDTPEKIVEKFANTLRRMGINVIAELELITDLSYVFTVSLPDYEEI